MKSSFLLSFAAFLALSGSAQAVNVVFTLGAGSEATLAASSLTVTGLGTVPGAQQSPDSLGPRALTGTVTVDVDNITAPTSITFVSATIDAAEFGSPVQPAVGGGAGSATGEYGFQFVLGAFGTEYVAWRNSVTSLGSGSLVVSGGGAFAGTGVSFVPTAGTVDFGQVLVGTGNLNAIAPAANVSAGGSYTVAGNLATLSLPSFSYTYNTAFGGSSGTVRFTGSLIGTATVVPEPATSGFAAGAATLLLLRRRRK